MAAGASSESRIEREVRRQALALGVRSLKLNVTGQTGWPDALFLLPGGRPLMIEFKRPGQKPRPKQIYIHQLLLDAGYNVQTHDNIDDAMAAITNLLKD